MEQGCGCMCIGQTVCCCSYKDSALYYLSINLINRYLDLFSLEPKIQQ